MVTKTSFSVKLIEIDSLNIVHHCKYPIWFETGRNDFFKNAGIPLYKIQASGLFLPLSELECKFKSPAKSGDKILIITKLVYISNVRLKFEYKVINKLNKKTLATGKTVHVWTNKRVEPLNIEKTAPAIYSLLKQLAEPTDKI